MNIFSDKAFVLTENLLSVNKKIKVSDDNYYFILINSELEGLTLSGFSSFHFKLIGRDAGGS